MHGRPTSGLNEALALEPGSILLYLKVSFHTDGHRLIPVVALFSEEATESMELAILQFLMVVEKHVAHGG